MDDANSPDSPGATLDESLDESPGGANDETLTPRQQRQERRRRMRERREARRRRAAAKAAVASPGSAAVPQEEPELMPAAKSPPLALPTTTPAKPTFVTRHNQPLYLNNLYYGQTAFLVLAGPSLASLDLSLLQQRGIWSLGVNQSPSLVQTNAHTFVDPPRKFHAGIWLDPRILKIVPKTMFNRTLMWKVGQGSVENDGGTSGNSKASKPRFVKLTYKMAGVPCANQSPSPPILCRDAPGVIGYERNANFNAASWLDESSVNWGNSIKSSRKNKIPHTLNVMFAAVKICYALGFRRLYLLGCDFYMQASQPYAFSQGKDAGGCASNNNAYKNLNQMFTLLKPTFDAAGFEVFNCNEQSGFRVFPFRPYASAIEDARRRMPSEPWDVVGWYDAMPE